MSVLLRLTLLLSLFTSCTVFRTSETRLNRKIRHEITRSTVFSSAFTGFTLLDPVTGKTLVDVRGDQYFTPASNTKILTLAACLEILGDSIPSLQYAYNTGGQLLLKGTGDPTFLHPDFADWQLGLAWIKAQHKPFLIIPESVPRFGPGWSWDDFNEPYSAERSAFPVYGNLLQWKKQAGQWTCTPPLFSAENVAFSTYRGPPPGVITRKEASNSNIIFTASAPDSAFLDGFEQSIPMPASAFTPETLRQILADTLGTDVAFSTSTDFQQPQSHWQTLYCTPVDTVLRRMMYQSDNLIAEQLLMACGGRKYQTLDQDSVIQWMLDSVLVAILQRPRWVDGSGLSRYNLMTPQSLVQVLYRLWKTRPVSRLLSLFPAGGVSGTVSNWYPGDRGKPFVFAKTGSMGGVVCLSGYVTCRSGKTLIFSFMHNNFVGSNRPWKAEMQRILTLVRQY
jgi:D-alanyl-D-alanine carboxypeptidase/D-alanyl-D-alanine-endopeptidase (penicillin-binding protein 4)